MKTLKIFLIVLMAFLSFDSFSNEYHVSIKGDDKNEGSLTSPFRTIMAAIKIAKSGDVITVHEGTYREKIIPLRGGKSNSERIIYRAAPGEKVEIKGSEIITGWKKVKNGVWKVTIPNSFFGNYNPYKDLIFGDWFRDWGRAHHTGEVFLNEKSLYEMETIDKVFQPITNSKLIDPEGSTYTWFCESDDKTTTLWANFHKFDPNKELVEISTRNTCIYPDKPGINYITIKGFYISQAATQWAAPTAEQVGIIATHWNKGWIIEDNIISNSKCSGITLGKERSSGHNVWSNDIGSINNDGNIHYIEVVFKTLRIGWNKENIGSHIVRNNEIFDCGQAGICGSMGAVFSIIENNHIHHIYTKRMYSGAEMGGIKFHAAIDAIIRNNRIHHTDIGLWLDWMTQGTRVSSNLLYENDVVDVFLEVNHGPYLIDNNILLSPLGISMQSEGGAIVHNLLTGDFQIRSDLNRFTPYHLPHSTEIKGLSTIRSGDDRYYNNIFIGLGKGPKKEETKYGYGIYKNTPFPVWIDGNTYYNGAISYENEEHYIEDHDFDPNIELIEKKDGIYLNFIAKNTSSNTVPIITTALLGKAIITGQKFNNPDNTPLAIDKDYFGNKRSTENNKAGPFINIKKGAAILKVW